MMGDGGPNVKGHSRITAQILTTAAAPGPHTSLTHSWPLSYLGNLLGSGYFISQAAAVFYLNSHGMTLNFLDGNA